MPKLRRLSGLDVVGILRQFGFQPVSQHGSHTKLRRQTPATGQTLTVPLHAELDSGTLRAIVRQAARFIPEGDLRQHFYR